MRVVVPAFEEVVGRHDAEVPLELEQLLGDLVDQRRARWRRGARSSRRSAILVGASSRSGIGLVAMPRRVGGAVPVVPASCRWESRVEWCHGRGSRLRVSCGPGPN